MSDWTIRPGVRDDENCIAQMWHFQLCHGSEAERFGAPGAAVKNSRAEQRFWEENEPIVTGLLRSANVLVACDPERSTYEPSRPAIIWAWAVTGADDWVYGVGIKRSAVRARIAEDIVRDLLGDRLDRHQRTVLELLDMRGLHMIPSNWSKDDDWMGFMRDIAQISNPVFQDIVRHIVDPGRQPWLPKAKRAA